MRRHTAEKVADLLGLVEQQLKLGRPRKPPGRERPEATDLLGKPCKASASFYLKIGKISLPGALKLAAQEQQYSYYVRKLAESEIRWAFYEKAGIIDYLSLEEIDANEYDTRYLRRIVKAARRYIEREYLS